MKLSKFSNEEMAQFSNGVILVMGKHMNRTALGIVDAILTLYPDCTFAELKEMLPDSINPSAPKNYRSLFAPYSPDRKYGVIQPGSIRSECQEQGLDVNASHFTDSNEVFHTKDGIEVLVSKSWESKDTLTGDNDLQSLINHVKQYGVAVNSFEPRTEPFKKGSYELHYIHQGLFDKITNPKIFGGKVEKKDKKNWWLIGLLILFISVSVYFFTTCKKNSADSIPANIEKLAPAVTPITEAEKLKADVKAGVDVVDRSVRFQNILFGYNSAKLLSESDSSLAIAFALLAEMPNLIVEIGGHTSDEGSVEYNQELSLQRASSVKQYLIGKGIDKERLSVKGYGKSQPLKTGTSADDKKINRRIEFKIIKG